MSLPKHTRSILIQSLKDNSFDISSACEELGITLADFNSCRSEDDFQAGLIEARQIRDDMADQKFMSLVKQGHAQSVIEYQKMLRQSDDKNTALNIRKKTMKYLVETALTKSIALRKFSDIFDESAKVAEKFYQVAMTEFSLLSPKQRIEKEKKDSSQKLSTLFQAGKLNEVSMLKGLLKQALFDAENAEYPSERAKASEQSIKLTQRMDEIEEKQNREKEQDNIPLYLKVDALLMGSSPERVAAIEEKMNDLKQKNIIG